MSAGILTAPHRDNPVFRILEFAERSAGKGGCGTSRPTPGAYPADALLKRAATGIDHAA